MLPLANIDELDKIWNADKRLPTLPSRRAWAEARNLQPSEVNFWFWRKRTSAKAKGIALASGYYHLPVGTPPCIKDEPIEEELTRSSSPEPLPSIKSEPESPRTSPPPSEDLPLANICASDDDEKQELHYDLHLPEEFHQDHQELESGDSEEAMSIDTTVLPRYSSQLRPWSLSTFDTTNTSCLNTHSIFKLDEKIYTPDGFQVPESHPDLYPHAYVVETSTKPNDFPILSELSESDYLPPLAPEQAKPVPFELKDSFVNPQYDFIEHTSYKRRLDSREYETLINGDSGLDTGSTLYRAFVRRLTVEWEGDDGWLMRKELYLL